MQLSKEDVIAIVEESAIKTRKEIEEYVNDMFVRRHDSISETVSNQYKEIRQTLTTFADMFKEHAIRVKDTEKEISEIKTWKAVHSSEGQELKQKIDDIQTNLSRLMWLVITGVVVALLGLILK